MAIHKKSIRSRELKNKGKGGGKTEKPIPNISGHRPRGHPTFHTHTCKQCVVLDKSIAKKAPRCYNIKCKKLRDVPCELHKKYKHKQTTASLEARKKLIKDIHKMKLKKEQRDNDM